MLISVTSIDLLLPINVYLNLSLALLIKHVFSFSVKPRVWKWKEKTTFFVHSLLSLYYNRKKNRCLCSKFVGRCVYVLFNLDCRSKSIWHLKKFVIHKSTVALCIRLCLLFRTFYRKYAYSCYAYKKKLV